MPYRCDNASREAIEAILQELVADAVRRFTQR